MSNPTPAVQFASMTILNTEENRLDLDGLLFAREKADPVILLHAIQRKTEDEDAGLITMRVPLDQGGRIAASFLQATGHQPAVVPHPHLEDASPELLRSVALALLLRAQRAEAKTLEA